jgi:hypothetical protein
MLKLAKNGLARPFHEKIYGAAQSATNYARWVNTQNSILRSFTRADLLQQYMLLTVYIYSQHDGTNLNFKVMYGYRIMY